MACSKICFAMLLVYTRIFALKCTSTNDIFCRCLMEIKERVFHMSERFPWITKLYVQSLSLISVSELLNSDVSNSLTSNFLLAKFAYFWRQLKQSHSIEVNGELLTSQVLFDY